MESNKTAKAIFLEMIEAYEEKYNLEKIQSASEDELHKLMIELEHHIEQFKITQYELSEITTKPEKYLKKPNETPMQYSDQLKAVNEIILHMESILKHANIEMRKYNVAGLKEAIKELKSVVKKKVEEIKNEDSPEKEIPEYILQRKEHLPDNALDYLIEEEYDKDKFEKIISQDGKNMILLNWIENINSQDILNIRNENGDIVLSIRLKSGNISSLKYHDIAVTIDQTRRSYETRRNLSNYYLTMTDEERVFDEERFKESYVKTSEKEKEWKENLDNALAEIEKLNKLEHLLWQTVEQWKAGIWEKPSTFFRDTVDKQIQLIENVKADKSAKNDISKEQNMILWKGTKTEFCRKMKELYEGNKNQYRSLRSTIKQEFPKYAFEDKDWTWEKCYELSKQP